MDINYSVINNDEKAIFKMRSLYKKYGYSQFKMSKFEEYDLYVRNKDFLVSENIITFTDTNGKLMALKPDVTLSIIKNNDYKPGQLRKVFYDENVYRVSSGTDSFKEIMQVGLECIGDIDTYNIFEVIFLAAMSLKGISENYVLDISNLDIVTDMIDELNADAKSKSEIIKCIGEKNIHGITAICNENLLNEEIGDRLKKLVSLHGDMDYIIGEVKKLALPKSSDSVTRFENIVHLFKNSGIKNNVRIDFSVISDTHYYNGFAFKGFIEGISSWVLSGGQYDNLMKKMRLSAGAVGFAVYLDLLERFETNADEYDVDTVLLYNTPVNINNLNASVNSIADSGRSVMASKAIPTGIKYRRLCKFGESGVDIIEENA